MDSNLIEESFYGTHLWDVSFSVVLNFGDMALTVNNSAIGPSWTETGPPDGFVFSMLRFCNFTRRGS